MNIRIRLIIVLIIFLISGKGLTQTENRNIEFGIIINGGLTDLLGQDNDKELKFGFGIGLFGKLKISENKNTIITGLRFEQKGRKRKGVELQYDVDGILYDTTDLEVNATFDYLTVPIKWGIQFENGFSIEPGIYLSYLIRQKTVLNKSQNRVFNNIDSFNRFDFGITLEGFKTLGNSNIEVFIKSSLGILPVNSYRLEKDLYNFFNQAGIRIRLNPLPRD